MVSRGGRARCRDDLSSQFCRYDDASLVSLRLASHLPRKHTWHGAKRSGTEWSHRAFSRCIADLGELMFGSPRSPMRSVAMSQKRASARAFVSLPKRWARDHQPDDRED
jgi:hypothetical protein